METWGMVHALEKIHRLLKPDGRLLDIRPAGVPPSLEVHVGEEVHVAGRMGHRNDFASDKQASAAIAQAIERGLYRCERESTFPFLYYADTLAVLREWLAQDWENYILDEETVQRAEELSMAAGDDGRVAARRQTRIMSLKPVHSGNG